MPITAPAHELSESQGGAFKAVSVEASVRRLSYQLRGKWGFVTLRLWSPSWVCLAEDRARGAAFWATRSVEAKQGGDVESRC